jgi:tetratricopeptide (TPR) repeat protein
VDASVRVAAGAVKRGQISPDATDARIPAQAKLEVYFGTFTGSSLTSARVPILLTIAVAALAGAAAQTLQEPPPAAKEEGQLDASPSVFAVLAAINAAGYDDSANSTAAHPLRKFVREQMQSKQSLPSVQALRKFYLAHSQADPGAELGQYVSFALATDGPPDFKYRLTTNPPDVAFLEGLPELMTQVYKDADIESLWKKAQPALDQMIAYYHGPLSQALLQANAYLRNPTSGVMGHRFQVYIDLLGAPGQTQSRSYAGNQYVVITPSVQQPREHMDEMMHRQVFEVRHAYLHYVLDSMAVRYKYVLDDKAPIAKLAQKAPALGDEYKQDFLLLTTECLIKAVEIRLDGGGADARAAKATEALHDGFILTPVFVDLLPDYEHQDRAMRLYYSDMMQTLDYGKVRKLVSGIQFASAAPKNFESAPKPPQLTDGEKSLMSAEDLSDRKQYDLAKQAFQKTLESPPSPYLHARAYFGLARIAILENHGEVAQGLFQHSLALSPDGETRSWDYFYLARLAEVTGDNDQAHKYYEAVLSVEGASPKAKEKAQQGLRGELSKKAENQPSRPQTE